MLSLNTIKPTGGSRKKSKKLGRGNGSGKWTFCGRGMNGQNSRSGWGVPQWFEWGQTPLFRRMPKLKGFSNARFTKKYNILNLKDLNVLIEKKIKTIDSAVLLENGMLRMKNAPVKLLGDGELSWVVTVKVSKASASAIAAVEKAGWTIEFDITEENTTEEKSVKAEKVVKTEKVEKPVKKEAPKVAEKKAPAAKATDKADNLTKIEGIGPKIAETLTNAWVASFADLSKKKPEDIATIIADVRGSHIPDTWPKQAEMAAEWKWDELKKWQDEMDGGKPA